MQEVIVSLDYVINGNLFWQSMGMTSASAIFIGAMLFHETDKNNFNKAIMTVLVYALFLIFTSAARVQPHIAVGSISAKTYASSITILLITFSYVFGLMIGYCMLKRKEKR